MEKTTEEKTVRVYFLGDSEAMRAMKRATGTRNTQTVQTMAEANLIVAENIESIAGTFKKEKQYAIITVEETEVNLPTNVTVFQAPFELTEYFNLISKIATIKPEEEKRESAPGIFLCSDAKHILVVDDSPQNIASAKKLLAGHYLTTAESYDEAMEILDKKKFDIVMVDLYLPVNFGSIASKTFRLGDLVTYGFLLMCEAARKGAGHVAIVTDLDHHADPFSAAFDHFSKFSFRIDNAKLRMLPAKKNTDGSKDWSNAFKRLLEE